MCGRQASELASVGMARPNSASQGGAHQAPHGRAKSGTSKRGQIRHLRGTGRCRRRRAAPAAAARLPRPQRQSPPACAREGHRPEEPVLADYINCIRCTHAAATCPAGIAGHGQGTLWRRKKQERLRACTMITADSQCPLAVRRACWETMRDCRGERVSEYAPSLCEPP